MQTHGSEIRFRNVYLREIPAAEANATLDKLGDNGFKSIFNGKNFNGWGGPVDEYEVRDGAIACKPHKGGTIHTNEEYGDFEARLEFKLPPGGNNGLAIRYPGEGTPPMSACASSDPRRRCAAVQDSRPAAVCCSIYGVVPVHRGYLRRRGNGISST